MDSYRIEKDALGEVRVPADHLWGAQTQRSIDNFPIGVDRFRWGRPVIRAFGILKKCAAETNGAAPVVRAHAKYVRTSARKARLVCDHIRGKSVLEARAILALTPRHVARDWSKLLESAVANAENNHELIGDELRIASVTADEGPTLKRYRPRAMGRATRIRKRTSHLTILLTPKES